MRATVSTFRSAQDQHEESGNKTQGTRWKLKTQLVKDNPRQGGEW
jgi:hypothetical protein